MRLQNRVLRDADGDGFTDSLLGDVYLSNPLTLEGVQAGAELMAWLSQDALCLPVVPKLWAALQPALFIGQEPPENPPIVAEGAALTVYPSALLFSAVSAAELRSGARHLNNWPLEDALNTLGEGLTPPLTEFAVCGGLVTLRFSDELSQVPDWALLPGDLRACITPSAVYANPDATPSLVRPAAPQLPSTFSLARAFQGGGLFTGLPHAPELLQGGLSIETPVAEALGVAARLSTEGLVSPRALTVGAENARVRLLIDDTDGAEVRVCDREGSVLEIAGGTAQDVSRAAAYVADTFPFLPDGTDFEKLEADLSTFLTGETPWGRVASLGSLQGRLQGEAVRALLPHPPSATPRLLGLPVSNTARDGKRRDWRAAFRWEGDRFLDVLAATLWTAGQTVRVEGYLSESKSVRDALRTRVGAFLQSRGVTSEVTLRSAYKPGLCWLLEELGPRLKTLNVTRLEVRCRVQHRGLEPEDRWLRELYPVGTLLEQTYGVSVQLSLESSETVYQVVGLDASGQTVFEDRLNPPTTETPLNGIRAAGFVYPTSGQLIVREGSRALLEQQLPTDRDLFWHWFTQTVLPEVSHQVAPETPGPYFGELSTVISLSEPDHTLGLDHEQLSATESLHEDLYFGTLEALHHAAELAPEDRSLAPGRILPFCAVAEGKETTARVTLRELASYRLGLIDASGVTHEVPTAPFTLSVRSVRLPSTGVPHVTLDLKLGDEEAAQHYAEQLRWAGRHRDALGVWDPFPADTQLSITVKAPGQRVRTVVIRPRTSALTTLALPERPLLTREVTTYAQGFADRHAPVYLRPLRESLFGAPLVALEISLTPYASRARRAAWKPTVLISARQHANEPSSTNAMFRWLERALAQKSLLKYVNVVFHPLENPDGARLHAALCQLSASHMHHAARYTGVGADLQANPQVRGALIPESELRNETGRRWRPELHLNCHGYPAHEWVRANGGYVPQHFGAWSLPFGYFTILSGAEEDRALLGGFKRAVAKVLAQHPQLQQTTQRQISRARQHMQSRTFPFELEEGFPFLLTYEKSPFQTPERDFAPQFTVITEVPDETVSGALWQDCAEAHQLIAETAIRTFLTVGGTDLLPD